MVPAADLDELLIRSVIDYAIYILNRQRREVSWNPGAKRIKGYTAGEITDQHFPASAQTKTAPKALRTEC
jgi:hypothetical protein